MDVTIRPAASPDVRAVTALVESAYRGYLSRMGGQKPGPMLADYRAVIFSGDAWVATDAVGVVVGLIVLGDGVDHLLVGNVAVDPAVQGSGVGTRLLDFAERTAADRGYAELRLYTHETMVENIAYYTRRGWIETDRRTENGYRRVFFRKPVPTRS